MCGRAGLTVPPDQVAGAVRSAGCAVPAKTCATYRTSSAKKADADSFPCVVAAPGGVDLATLGFGVKKLRCHNAFVEGWLDRKTWREAAATPRGRCSMVVTSFVEGITARKPDDGVFFILGLRVGDEFVIAETDATLPQDRRYKSIVDCASKTLREEGAAAFFKGYTPTIARAVPVNGAIFLAYSAAKEAMEG